MIPVPYSKAIPLKSSSKEYITIVLEDDSEYTGEFSSLRIDRDTIPEGKYAYDLRDSDGCTGDVCQVKNYILVNHFGTMVTDTPIEGIDDGPIVKEWWLSDE